MDLPMNLRAAVEELAEAFPMRELTRTARELSDRYLRHEAVIASELDAVTYAAMRMPATYAACAAAMQWTRQLLPEEALPRSLLDVGAGTGAGVLAVGALFPLESVCCLEQNSWMMRTGQRLLEAGSVRADWRQRSLTDSEPLPRAELVLASYMLNELSPAERAGAVSRLWAAAESVLLLVEPGTPHAFRALREDRERLLAEGAHLLAPCPHAGACPLPAEDWCHFTARAARGRLQKQLKDAQVPYEDEKFCYLAFTRAPLPRADRRVLRHPRIDPGRVTLQLCTPGGLQELACGKRDAALFRAARKCHAGDSL
ncbi:MAG: rRNA methyltransferase [Clostridia bacterium]|nr:rRNA methyltransferase [Clostridia bacterium]